MTQADCIKQAIGRIGGISRTVGVERLAQFAADVLLPLTNRDATIDPGLILVEEVDPETGEHRTVERRIHPPRRVAPYNYGAQDVLWLEREIRRRAGL